MRLQYETQIESLTDEIIKAKNKISKESSSSLMVVNNKGIGQIPLEEIKTFGQAKEKIQYIIFNFLFIFHLIPFKLNFDSL